ncbi:GNAT family acetyltransferase [Methylobacterium sp. EM32]|uniref:GNAT family acetyltransferase n=1 Tax=Methylobacterium sp. EM32 TaxID=3163481 RepID=UPI0033B30E2C
MTPTIREIEDADILAVIALWHEAGVARPWNDPATDIAFARRGPHGTVLVAEADGRILASAMAGEDGHRGWLYYVAVTPGQQGSGLGRRMVEAAEAWLAARGVWKVQLLVRRENDGVLGFYDHLGYRDTNAVCLQKVIAKG